MALGLSSSLSWNHSITRRTPVWISPSRVPAKTFTVVAQKKVKKFCQVVLKEDIPPTGKAGDLCRVRQGYLRNYLLPRGMAQRATAQLLKEMKMEEERIEAEKQREAQQLALLLETYGPLKVKRTGGKGKLIFGTDVDKRTVSVPDIRETGLYIATIKLHSEVTAQVRLIVQAN